MASDSRADDLTKRYTGLKSKRAVLETHWQEVTDYMAPWRTDFIRATTPGQKRGQFLLDGTAMLASANLGAGLWGMLTNSAQQWFTLRSQIDELNDDYQVKQWLSDAEAAKRNEFASNGQAFYNKISEFYLDLVIYGTAIFYVEELPGGEILFSNRSLFECVIDENAKEQVDTVIRSFKLTARQALQKWPKDVSEKIRKAAQSEPDKEFDFLHAVLPREDFLPGRFDVKGKPVASLYIEMEERKVVEEKGYRIFPFPVCRWSRIANTPYGAGPGMYALPDAKMLQVMSGTALDAAEMSAKPMILAPDEMGFRGIRQRPGEIIYGGMNAQGQRMYDLMQNGANHGLTETMLERVRIAIREAFHASLLMMVDRANMTATEVIQREQEKMRLLGPHMGRVTTELHDPLMDIVFDIMARNGRFPEPPDVLKQYPDLKVEYVSPMARAQRSSEAMAIDRTLQSITPLIQVNPEVLDNFDIDEMARTYADINGVPAKVMKDPKAVQQSREQRAQAQQAQQSAAVMPEMAGAMKDMALTEKAAAEAQAA